jgi:RNA polymerase sigma-70 factor (ECF subfamily)
MKRNEPSPGSSFATTHWSIVLGAGGDNASAARSLEVLCRRYWYPLYAFVRRQIGDVEEARDLTQAFFVRLIEKKVVSRADPERGRFRSFLLGALKNFLANEHDRKTARKRGGTHIHWSLDLEAGESRFNLEPAHHETPERIFDRDWALRLLELVVTRLRQEFGDAGQSERFEKLQAFLQGKPEAAAYASAAASLNMTEEATRQAVHRLRKRYRELLRAEVADTVATAEDVEAEIRGLFEAVGR